MEEVKRTYSKGNPEKEPLHQPKKKTVEVEVQGATVSDIQMSTYQKADIEEPPRAFFILISGGEVREKDYFKIISVKDKRWRIKLEFIADPLKLSPDGMLELAEYKKTRYATSQNKDAEADKIYLISDVDHFMNELLRIKPKCESEGFQLIISNPCFEIWLYYAYCDTIPDFPLPPDPLKISSKFKSWLPSAIPGGIKPAKAILSIYRNIENAKKNYKEDENRIPILFSTNMYLLAEDLLPLIEPELTNMIDENARIEADFREKSQK
ncbi:RloB family protein [Bacteroides ihuae]|uniref:RloB family protein n=1 Tax=Bacteroides ihuae TaxID=1852362 RepID=UPI0008DA3B56|nr:RloB family protein [Bacteroides ihuae]